MSAPCRSKATAEWGQDWGPGLFTSGNAGMARSCSAPPSPHPPTCLSFSAPRPKRKFFKCFLFSWPPGTVGGGRREIVKLNCSSLPWGDQSAGGGLAAGGRKTTSRGTTTPHHPHPWLNPPYPSTGGQLPLGPYLSYLSFQDTHRAISLFTYRRKPQLLINCCCL